MKNQITKNYLVKWLMCGIFAYLGINLVIEFAESIFQLIFAFLKPSILVNTLITALFGIAKIAAIIIIFFLLIKNSTLPATKIVNRYLLIGLIIYALLFLINMGLQFLNTAILSRNLGAHDFGQLTLYKHYTSYGLMVIKTLTLVVLGIIALVTNKSNTLSLDEI